MKTAEDILSEKGGDIISVTHDTTIHEALEFMIEKKVGAVIVKKENHIIGIWTSRDLMRNTVSENFDPKTSRIEDYMVINIFSAPHTDTAFNLMDKFLGLRINHLLVEKNGEYIGMLSTGDVMKATIQEKTEELDQLNTMVSWEYYEEWKWKPSKKNIR
jgi:signal-transduction protein with cAMP-binding, CBS, and nucleotidyltransferase domain